MSKTFIPTRTLNRFLRERERIHNGSGELTELIMSISVAVKMISQLVATAGFKGLYGYTDQENASGDRTQLLDQVADEILVQFLSSSGHFGLLVSEERDTVLTTDIGHDEAKYVVAFDPLDGSSNIGSNIPVGTIFSIFRKRDFNRAASTDDYLQAGRHCVAAGYSVYGAKTSFVYSSGEGVHGFTLDPSIGEFILTDESIRTPEEGKTYSINEGNSYSWSPEFASYISEIKKVDSSGKGAYSARYVGSLVADFDRNLKKGGIFLYPANQKNPRGRLRLLYEVIPLSFIQEQAGGLAIDGKKPILDIVPADIHERAPLIVGSKKEVEKFLQMTS